MDDSGCVRAVFSTSNGTYPYKEARHAVRKIFRKDFWSDVRDMALRLRQEFPQQCGLIDPNDDWLVEKYFDAFDIQMQSRQFLSEVLWSIAACHNVMVEEHAEETERQASEFAERVVLDDKRYGRLTVTSLVSSVFTEDERASVGDDDDLLGALAKLKAYKFPKVFAGFAHDSPAVNRRLNAYNPAATAADGRICGQANSESYFRGVSSIKPQTRHSPSRNTNHLEYHHYQEVQPIPRFSHLQPPTHPVIMRSRSAYGEEPPGGQRIPQATQPLMLQARDQQLLQQSIIGPDPLPNFHSDPGSSSSLHRPEFQEGKHAGISRGSRGKMHKVTPYRQQNPRGARLSTGTRTPARSTSDDCRQYESAVILHHDPTPLDQARMTPTAPQYPYLHHPWAFSQVLDRSSSSHLAASKGSGPTYLQTRDNQPRSMSFHTQRDSRLTYPHLTVDPRQFETSLTAHSQFRMLPNAFPSAIMEEPQCEWSLMSNRSIPSPSDRRGPKAGYHDNASAFHTSKCESTFGHQLSKPVLNEHLGHKFRQSEGLPFPGYGNQGVYEYHRHLEPSVENQRTAPLASQLSLSNRYQTPPSALSRQNIFDQEANKSLRPLQNRRPSFNRKKLRTQQGGHHPFNQDHDRYHDDRRQSLDREQSSCELGCQERFDREQTRKQQKRRPSFQKLELPPPPDDCVLFISGFPVGFDKRALSKMIGPLPGLIALTDPRTSKSHATSSLANVIFLDPHFATEALRNLPTMRFAAMQGKTLSVRPFDSSLVHPCHVRRFSMASWSDRSSGSIIEHNSLTLAASGRSASLRADHDHRSQSLISEDHGSAQRNGCIAELTPVGNDHDVYCGHTNADGSFDKVYLDDLATVIQGSQIFDLALRTAKTDDIAVHQLEVSDSSVHVTAGPSFVRTGSPVKKTRRERTSPRKTLGKKAKDSRRAIPTEATRDPSPQSTAKVEHPNKPLPKKILQGLSVEEDEAIANDPTQSQRSFGAETVNPIKVKTGDLPVDTIGWQARPMRIKHSSDRQAVECTRKDSKDISAWSDVSEDQAQANQRKQPSQSKPKRSLKENARDLSVEATETADHSMQSMYPLEARPAGSVNVGTAELHGTSSKTRTQRTQSNQLSDAKAVVSTPDDNTDIPSKVSGIRDRSAPHKQPSEAQSVGSVKTVIDDNKARPWPVFVASGAKLKRPPEDRNLSHSQDEAGAFTIQTTPQLLQTERPCGKEFGIYLEERKRSVILPETVSATRDITSTVHSTEASLLDETQLTPRKAAFETVAQDSEQTKQASKNTSEDPRVVILAPPPISAGAQPDPNKEFVRGKQTVALAEDYPLLRTKRWATVASPGKAQQTILEQNGPLIMPAAAAPRNTCTVQSPTKIAVSASQQKSDAEASQREFAARVVQGPGQGNSQKQKGKNRHSSNSANVTDQQWGPKSQIPGTPDASDFNAKASSFSKITGRRSSGEAQVLAKEQRSIMKVQTPEVSEATEQQPDVIFQVPRINRESATSTAFRSPERLAIPQRSTPLAQCSPPSPIVACKKKQRKYIAMGEEQVELDGSTATANKLEERKQENSPLTAHDSSTIQQDPTDSTKPSHCVFRSQQSPKGNIQNAEADLLPSKEDLEEIGASRSTLTESKVSVTILNSPCTQPLSLAGPLLSDYCVRLGNSDRASKEVSSLKSKNNRKKIRNGKKKKKKRKQKDDGQLSIDVIPSHSSPITLYAASTRLTHHSGCHGPILSLERNPSELELPWDAEALVGQSIKGSGLRHEENENAEMSLGNFFSLSDRNNGNEVGGHEADAAQTSLFPSSRGRAMTALDEKTEFALRYSKKMAHIENMKAPGPYRRWKKIEALPATAISGSDKPIITRTMREAGLTDATCANHFGIPKRPRPRPTKTDFEDMSEDSFMLRHNSYESGMERIQNLCEAEEETQGSLYTRILPSDRLENCSKGVKIHRAPLPRVGPSKSRRARSKDSAGHVVHNEEQTHRKLMQRERVIALDRELRAVIREAVQKASTFASDEEDLEHGRRSTLESERAKRILKVAALRETSPLNPETDWDDEWTDEWCNEAAEWLFEKVPRLTEGQKKLAEEWEREHPSMRKNLLAFGFTVPEIIELGLDWVPQPWIAGADSTRLAAQDGDAKIDLTNAPLNLLAASSCGQFQEVGEKTSIFEDIFDEDSKEGNKKYPNAGMVEALGEQSRSREKMIDETSRLKVETTIKQLEEGQIVAKKEYRKQHRTVDQNELMGLGLSEPSVAKGRKTSAESSTSTRKSSSPSKLPRPSATRSLPSSSSREVAKASLEAAQEPAVDAIAKTTSISKSAPQAPPTSLTTSPTQLYGMDAADSVVPKPPVVRSTSDHAPALDPATSRPSYASVVAEKSDKEGKAADTWETQGKSAWGLAPATVALPVAAAAAGESGGDD